MILMLCLLTSLFVRAVAQGTSRWARTIIQCVFIFCLYVYSPILFIEH